MATASGGTGKNGNVSNVQNSERPNTYANRLKTNVSYSERLKRNILEITIEKTSSDAEIILDDKCVHKVLRSIGMDIISQLEGYQVQFNGRTSVISVWATQGLNLEKFCKEEGIIIGKGVVTGHIRPAGKMEVLVTVVGLDFNTPDSLVFNYIQKFGGIITNNSVIYSKYSEGPFKGKFNGERRYEVDFTNARMKMGTYHYLDGSRVKIFYRGNAKTCGRCHGTSHSCPGNGIAKDCQEAGGRKIPLSEHMKTVWSAIDFNPTSFALTDCDTSDDIHDKPLADSATLQHTPNKVTSKNEADEERFTGLSIANVSLEVSDTDIIKFIRESVSSDIKENAVTIVREKKKAVVNINHSLTKTTIRNAMTKINFSDCKEKFFGKPLYCRPLRNITPEKRSSCSTPKQHASSFTDTRSSHPPDSKGRGCAFDIMMKAAQTSKRGSDQLSSPSSPVNNTSKDYWQGAKK